ncbi:CYTH and CHAD domain-containing protein [Flindersiella endophytica]
MPNPTCPHTLRWRGRPTRGDGAAVLAGLEPLNEHYDLSAGARRTRTASYLDTVDGRLRKRGQLLSHERATGPGRLVLVDGEAIVTTGLTEVPEWPARVEEFPPGDVLDRVASAMWVRAVLPIARSRTTSREVAVLNEDGKTVVRLDWVEVTGSEPVRTEPLAQVVVRPVLGYQRDADRVRKALLAADGFEESGTTAEDELVRTATAAIEPPGRPAITADQPAGLAIALALLGFADAIAANVDGVVDDIDTEFLHDLRVAVRRTRSLLKLAGDVLPLTEAQLARYAASFKWLGDVTTPTRDLDVYLLEIDQLAGKLVVGEPGDLEPFAAHLLWQRQREQRKLARTLRSQRFARLLDGWTAFLTEVVETEHPVSAEDTENTEGAETAQPTEPTEPATTAAGQLAAQRIRHMVKRVGRRGRVLTPGSPAEHIHALRKRCKELRYLLEVFRPLCDHAAHQAVVKELKQLQDVLGSFQDGEVQSEGLRMFAEQMLQSGRPPAATLLAMGELAGRFGDQQKQARQALTDRVERFVSARNRQRIEALLP